MSGADGLLCFQKLLVGQLWNQIIEVAAGHLELYGVRELEVGDDFILEFAR